MPDGRISYNPSAAEPEDPFSQLPPLPEEYLFALEAIAQTVLQGDGHAACRQIAHFIGLAARATPSVRAAGGHTIFFGLARALHDREMGQRVPMLEPKITHANGGHARDTSYDYLRGAIAYAVTILRIARIGARETGGIVARIVRDVGLANSFNDSDIAGTALSWKKDMCRGKMPREAVEIYDDLMKRRPQLLTREIAEREVRRLFHEMKDVGF